tara:strand:- start:123 stop:302 length:180 start_codon:yes stop_codon:yes gene_type:complete
MQLEAQLLHVAQEDKVEHQHRQDHLDQELQEQQILVVEVEVDFTQDQYVVLEQQVVQEL